VTVKHDRRKIHNMHIVYVYPDLYDCVTSII